MFNREISYKYRVLVFLTDWMAQNVCEKLYVMGPWEFDG